MCELFQLTKHTVILYRYGHKKYIVPGCPFYIILWITEDGNWVYIIMS